MLWSSAPWSTGDSCTSRLPKRSSEPEQGLDHLRDAVVDVGRCDLIGHVFDDVDGVGDRAQP